MKVCFDFQLWCNGIMKEMETEIIDKEAQV